MTIVVIQARMGSERLPGKSMLKIAGKPSLAHLVDSLRQTVDSAQIHVATSDRPENEPIRALCQELGIHCFAGDEHDVASRFVKILTATGADCAYRISGDSPLMDFRILDEVRAAYLSGPDTDLATTVHAEAPFPSGMNIELINASTFLREYPHFHAPAHFEHVTRYFYENDANFRIRSVACGVESGRSYKFSLDTSEDQRRILRIFEALGDPHHHHPLREKCRIYRQLFSPEELCEAPHP